MDTQINPEDSFVKEVFKVLTNLADGDGTISNGVATLELMYGFDHNTAGRFVTAWTQLKTEKLC